MKPIDQHTDLRQMARDLMKDEGWNQETLATLIGTRRQNLCNWINGHRGVPYPCLERLLWLMRIREYKPRV